MTTKKIFAVNVPPTPNLSEVLKEIAAQQRHASADPDFKPVVKHTNLQILSDYYTDTGDPTIKGQHRAICRCICGKEIDANYKHVKRGFLTSCGCLRSAKAERIAERRQIEKEMATPKGHRDWTKAGENSDGVFGYLRFVGWERRSDGVTRTGKRKTKVLWKAYCICGSLMFFDMNLFKNRANLCCDSPTCQRLYVSKFSRAKAKATFDFMRKRGETTSLEHFKRGEAGSPE